MPHPAPVRLAAGRTPAAWYCSRPLGAYVARQLGPTCLLSFRQVEALLGRPLPPVASARRPWWSNHHSHPQAYHGWLAAGWRVASVDLDRQVVAFRQG